MFQLWNAYDLLCVQYPLFQLKGTLTPFCGCTQISVSVDSFASPKPWYLCNHLFKVFVCLRPGSNLVRLTCSHFCAYVRLIYAAPPDETFIVQPVYVTCSDDDGSFQTPVGTSPGTIDSAFKKIGLGLRILQSLTAESFYLEFGKRYTFTCTDSTRNTGSGSRVSCYLHRSVMTREEMYTCSPINVWSRIARELHDVYPHQFEKTKWVAFLACTRYHPPSKLNVENYEEMVIHTKANYALGTGGLALVGTGTLHAWPEALDDLDVVLRDTRRLDYTGTMDDTAYRHTFWAAFATGLGTVWHELGHCFGLDHTTDGIMNRGGDDVHLCIGFPPLGSICADGCEDQSSDTFRGCIPENRIPTKFIPPKQLPTVAQFCKYTLLEPSPPPPTVESNSSAKAPWSRCYSLCHHGSAFWGVEHIHKLLQSPWIIRASKGQYDE